MKLTPKQARFVQEYLIDLNAARALDGCRLAAERALATMPCTVPTSEVWTPPAPGAGMA